jgi:hypothetical protein
MIYFSLNEAFYPLVNHHLTALMSTRSASVMIAAP